MSATVLVCFKEGGQLYRHRVKSGKARRALKEVRRTFLTDRLVMKTKSGRIWDGFIRMWRHKLLREKKLYRSRFDEAPWVNVREQRAAVLGINLREVETPFGTVLITGHGLKTRVAEHTEVIDRALRLAREARVESYRQMQAGVRTTNGLIPYLASRPFQIQAHNLDEQPTADAMKGFLKFMARCFEGPVPDIEHVQMTDEFRQWLLGLVQDKEVHDGQGEEGRQEADQGAAAEQGPEAEGR